MSRELYIYHICSTTGDPSNGMVNVIPEHVKAQCKEERACLINLKSFDFPKYREIIKCFNVEDIEQRGISFIEDSFGKPDLYVIHGLYLPAVWKFWRKNIYKKVPYIIVPHGTLTKAIQSRHAWKKKVANFCVVNRIIKNSTAIQFLSEGEKNNSISNKVHSFVCPNGIDLPAETTKLLSSPINLVYIGRIDIYHKGLDLLVGGVSQKKDFCRQNNIKVNIYGPTESGDYIKLKDYISREGLEDIIFLGGPVFGDEKKELLLESTYFIQTSRLEGLPMGILEAISYGLPVLITEGTFLGDQIKKYGNGLVVETTIDGVKELLSYAVNNIDNIATLSAKSKMCSKQYSWDVVGHTEISMYKKYVRIDQ